MTSTIASIATIQLPAPTQVLTSSWCPDKDLLVVFYRVSHQTKMALYKMQGSKKWEVTIDSRQIGRAEVEVLGVAWSPDAQSLAVISNPPLVSVHSIQTGQVVNDIPFSQTAPLKLANVWWFREEKKVVGNGIPDIFKRGDSTTGSALAILRNLPLLDPMEDDATPLNSNDLFAFQGTRNRAAPTARTIPGSIASWPAFQQRRDDASIAAQAQTAQQAFPEEADKPDDTNLNSILAVADTYGQMHLFLEGSYLLGTLGIRETTYPRSVHKLREFFFAHIGSSAAGDADVVLFPYAAQLPYLATRHCREVARVSTAARELAGYAIQVVKDMRSAWFGTETQGGARLLGQKWVQALEERQTKEFGQEEAYGLLDLTCLLTTGRSSEALMDFLGSGEHMSERSMHKWETMMTEALVKLRDMAEQRVAPAVQRLHLLLQEVQGWATLPQYAVCNINPPTIEACLELAASAIILSSWLATTARKELLRFREFMKWLRYETSRGNATGDHPTPRPQHDILEVNEYLSSSLVVSPIDKWFLGLAAPIKRTALGVPSMDTANLKVAVKKAREALAQWDRGTQQQPVQPRDLPHIERNLDSLLHALASRCQEVFVEACKAAGRSAVVLRSPETVPVPGEAATDLPTGPAAPLVRERTVEDDSKASDAFGVLASCRAFTDRRRVHLFPSPQPDNFVHCLAMRPPLVGDGVGTGPSYLCLARLQQGLGALDTPPTIEVAVFECSVLEDVGGAGHAFELVDLDFFDGSLLVIVYRHPEQGECARIATVGYADLLYHTIPADGYVTGTTRGALMRDVLARVAGGQLPAVPTPIVQSRPLGVAFKTGAVKLAVNGRTGRRVACVLDGTGTVVEVLDMEAEEDEEDVEDEDEDDADAAEEGPE
ncbi:anaphase-promoting complex, cyclosome, subunit 4-domain-containing protein [Epithele typhae]|uniref:anaphase-promoting complex, cyclosome, subunit 4-domain-containing protein n=1 Tax=Epithele typhae TaxID=378194 RepID=UPI00200842D1|nr:anaphase-promoting complex, cyclosome, subunit 4-domain-containing protein [Epithele typhae]KAH9944395.1 anaphase-promoting complex, cyclosome, subunit 4-domain-containing protein [Epithele typhae]